MAQSAFVRGSKKQLLVRALPVILMDQSLLRSDLQEPADLQYGLTSTWRKHFPFAKCNGIIKQGELQTLGTDGWKVS